jgi:hypothetical protein
MIKIAILIYLLIGWIWGLVNFILALTLNRNDRDYNLTLTMAIILYWPLVLMVFLYNFVGYVNKNYHKWKQNGRS